MKKELKSLTLLMHELFNESVNERGSILRRFLNNPVCNLRNRINDKLIEWYHVYITKTFIEIPENLKCRRNMLMDLALRRFRGNFKIEPCEVCGDQMAVAVAHIIPRNFGGSDDDWNLAFLCHNHHYLFDRGLLTKKEYFSIKWDQKGIEARYFSDNVRLKQHEQNWS
jgi:5-methylcytosine-specific restriction endonuclease McrA